MDLIGNLNKFRQFLYTLLFIGNNIKEAYVKEFSVCLLYIILYPFPFLMFPSLVLALYS